MKTLHTAVIFMATARVKLLVEIGASVNLKVTQTEYGPGSYPRYDQKDYPPGSTALNIARRFGFNDIERLLLDYGAVSGFGNQPSPQPTLTRPRQPTEV